MMSENTASPGSPYIVERSIDHERLNAEANQADPDLVALLGNRALVRFAASGMWELDAACRKPEVTINFYPEKISLSGLQAKAIRAVCNSCPVKDACRVAAFLGKEEFGVWGGLFPSERVETDAGKKSQGRRKRETKLKQEQLEQQ